MREDGKLPYRRRWIRYRCSQKMILFGMGTIPKYNLYHTTRYLRVVPMVVSVWKI